MYNEEFKDAIKADLKKSLTPGRYTMSSAWPQRPGT